MMTAEQLAQFFHESYERLAPWFGYKTREESAKPWAEVPEQNRKLMTAVCAEVLTQAAAQLAEKEREIANLRNQLNSQNVKLGHLRRGHIDWMKSLESELIESMRHNFGGKHLPHSTVANAIKRWVPSNARAEAAEQRLQEAQARIKELEESR